MTLAPDPAAGARERDPGIDLLRGLSIVLVVLNHVGLRIGLKHSVLAPWLPKRLLDAFIWNGQEAVAIFFVISGFLIASNSIRRWGSLAAIDARAFYVRRSARILPALGALLAVLGALDLAGLDDWAIDTTRQSLPRALLAALGLHLNWYEGRTGWLPAGWDVLWSLSIEEAFYLGFPVACLLLARTRAFVPALALLALSLPFTRAALAGNEIWQEKAYLPGMSAIAIGVLAALSLARVPRVRPTTAALTLALGVTGLAAVLFFESELWRVLADGCMLLLAACAGATLLALRWRRAAGASTAPSPAFAWLGSCGRLSYEIYLTHMFVVWPVVHAWRASGFGDAWGFLFYLPALAGAWGLGALVARLLSTPAERAVRRLLRPRRDTAASPSELQTRSL